MTASSDFSKMANLLKSLNSEKGFLVARSSTASFVGSVTEFEQYDIFTLSKSSNHSHINKDELFQKLKPTVIHTAHLKSQVVRDKLKQHLDELYPQHYHNIFVWETNSGAYSSTNYLAGVKFRARDNQYYGHDILILTKLIITSSITFKPIFYSLTHQQRRIKQKSHFIRHKNKIHIHVIAVACQTKIANIREWFDKSDPLSLASSQARHAITA